MGFAWRALDGVTFPAEEWPAVRPGRGVVIGVPGMGAEAADFGPVGQRLAAEGVPVYAVNLRGQGHDPQSTRRGHFLEPDVLGREIAAFVGEMSARHPGEPVFLCGESLGALLSCRAVALGQTTVDGLILSVPVVDLRRPTPWTARTALRLAAAVWPTGRFSPSWFVSGTKRSLPVSRDEAHLHRLRNSAHSIRVYTFRFLHAMGGLMREVRELAPRLQTPCLVLGGGCDVYITPQQLQAWFAEIAATDKSLRIFPEGHHCLWNDLDRAEVLETVADWMAQRVVREPSGGPPPQTPPASGRGVP
jgi:alpha-beta hydrolase superfamily lysophospholipase